ncbi:hypothetical protein [Teichococcus aestuarii]|uniref:hypothetical protein n=1 Tax=Teichococcus aestuarii TaxID=568898 RepID=UPI00360662D4
MMDRTKIIADTAADRRQAAAPVEGRRDDTGATRRRPVCRLEFLGRAQPLRAGRHGPLVSPSSIPVRS